MRMSGLLVAVLVLAGGVCAQYAGQGGDEQQQQQQTHLEDVYVTCDYNEKCVYWKHCYDGKLNTGGVGLIDPRTPEPIPSDYLNPRPCVSTGRLCCVDPSIPVDPVTEACPFHHECVPHEQCVDGEINTSGIGLIDVRLGAQKCVKPEYPNVPSVCCKLPGKLPLVTCPHQYQTCRYPSECDTAAGTYDTAAEQCYVEPALALVGVCCSPPVVQQCTRGHVCVSYFQCTEQGQVSTDGAGIFDPRTYDRCVLHGGEDGVCCSEPEPVDPHPPVVKCTEHNAVCSPTGYCQSEYLSAPNGYTETCYRTEGSAIIGECCIEEPVLTCSAEYSCNLPHQCIETPGIIANHPECKLNEELIGVCCTRKDHIDIVDVCQADAVCLPELLCVGNPHNIVPTRCRLSGTGLSNPGICCSTEVFKPNITIIGDLQCGEGSAGSTKLSTRIKSTNLLDSQAQFAEFPWMALIFFRNQTFKCGATIVDKLWVLTAAHCVAGFVPYDLRVRVGEWQVDAFDELYPYEDYDIESIIIHPDFNSKNLHSDMAVIKLARPVTYSYHINRICLPTPDRIHPAGTECVATGWGKDAFDGGKYQVIMKKVTLPIVPYDQCQDLLRQTRLGLFFILDKSFVCAGGKYGQDACTGDGGGPLACRNPTTGRYELYGMTAWGIGCGQEGHPGVYVNVPYFMQWVYDIVHFTDQQLEQHVAGPYSK